MDTRDLRLTAIRYEAQGIHAFEFRAPDGAALPPVEAGAHIDIHLPGNLVRSYSLCNAPGERHRHVVAVNRDAASRGGSRAMHEVLRVGQLVKVAGPRNHFALDEGAPHSVLIAGGIGITPLWCMVQRLAQLGRPWTLWYSARTRAQAAFVTELEALAAQCAGSGGTLHLNFDQAPGGRMLDLAEVVAASPADAHLYCCGPLPMLAAFEAATAPLPPARVHVEYFAAREAPALGGGFTVELARSGLRLPVPPGKSILDVMLEAGVDVPYSCCDGICASCETRVLSGIPDHRDQILSAQEQAANKVMMVCCSGSKSEVLVLDR